MEEFADSDMLVFRTEIQRIFKEVRGEVEQIVSVADPRDEACVELALRSAREIGASIVDRFSTVSPLLANKSRVTR